MNTIGLEMGSIILSVFCLAYSLTVKRQQYVPPKGMIEKFKSQHFVFLLLLINTLLSAVSSVWGAWLQGRASAETRFLQYLLHEVYFIFHTCVPASFTLYVMDVNGTTLGRKKSFYGVFLLPFVAAEVLTITNPLHSLIFYMDERFIYHRGPLIVLLYLVAAFYIILGIVNYVRYKQALSKSDGQAILAVIALAVAGILAQAFQSSLLLELFLESVAFLGLMILLENRGEETDLITGFYNRAAFARVNRRLMETGQSYTVLHVKQINLDLFSRLLSGRDRDRLIQTVAQWLRTVTDPENIFRFRTEDFAVILYGVEEREALALAETIRERYQQPWLVDEMNAQLEAVISVIRVPEDADSLDRLNDLMAAGYKKKVRGSVLVTGEQLAYVKRNVAVEKALRRALAEKTLQVWYQPIWSVSENKVVAAEALVRLIDPELGYVPPEEFIPIAERKGMIQDLGSYVFEEVCAFIQRNDIRTKGLAYIEINVSLYQFMHEGLMEDFGRLRGIYDVPVEQINIEITETASADEAPSVNETMHRMIGAGYTFSLDDYGTGYSNMVRLISSDYKNVKIDKSILWDAEQNESTARLLDNLIRVIRGLGLGVIQEGVETKAQLDRVVSSGCDLIQGFYYSKPLNEEEFLDYVIRVNRGK